MYSVTGLHVYYYFGHQCDYQLRRTVMESRPAIQDPLLLLLLESGRQNETRYVEKLRNQGLDVVSLQGGSMEERAVRTREAMRAGARVLHNGVLEGGPSLQTIAERMATLGVPIRFRGETDLLMRVDGQPSAFGSYAYRVIDVKSSRTRRLPQMMQVAYYDRLLEETQGVSLDQGAVIVYPSGPRGEPVEESFALAEVHPTLDLFLEEKLRDVLLATPDTLGFHLTDDCRRCLWFDHCGKRARLEKHLSLVPGLRPSQRKLLEEDGIKTTEALAAMPEERLESLTRRRTASAGGLHRLHRQATALVRDENLARTPLRDAIREWWEEQGRPASTLGAGCRGIAMVLESDFLAGVHFGYGVRIGSHQPQVFLAERPEEEDLAFFRFAEGMQRVLQKTQGHFLLLHLGGHTVRRLTVLMEKYPESNACASVAKALDRTLDVQAILRRAFFIPADTLVSERGRIVQCLRSLDPAAESLMHGTIHVAARLHAAGIANGPEEIARGAARIGCDLETLLGSPDLGVVAYRMYLERAHPAWLELAMLAIEAELQLVHTAGGVVLAALAPESQVVHARV